MIVQRKVLLILFLSVCASLSQPQAEPAWYYLGLEGYGVYSILADDTTMIVAGTDHGVMVLYNGNWYYAGPASNAHILDMARDGEGNVVAVVGGGSNSDGLYLGIKIRGEPYYQFSLIDWIDGIQKVVMYEDTIYAGMRDGLLVYEPDKDGSYQRAGEIKTPDYCFGVEMPVCGGIQYYSNAQRLFAGGYDASPMPGPGHLLGAEGDSMVIFQDVNVSALVEANFSVEGLGPSSLAVGTMDSGIHVYTGWPSNLDPPESWETWATPNDEAVLDMIRVPTLIWNDALVIAVESGVFTGGNGNWYEVGDLPEIPACIALCGMFGFGPMGSQYMTGTDDGVYIYSDTPVAVSDRAGENEYKPADFKITGSGAGVRLEILCGYAADAKIVLVDVMGRALCTLFDGRLVSGINNLSVVTGKYREMNIGSGVYFVRIEIEGAGYVTRPFVLTK